MKSSLKLFLKRHGQGIFFSLEKLPVLSHTSCVCLVRVLIVVALCDIGS